MHHTKRQVALALGSAMLVALLAVSTEAEAAPRNHRGPQRRREQSGAAIEGHRSSFGYQVPPGGYDRTTCRRAGASTSMTAGLAPTTAAAADAALPGLR